MDTKVEREWLNGVRNENYCLDPDTALFKLEKALDEIDRLNEKIEFSENVAKAVLENNTDDFTVKLK